MTRIHFEHIRPPIPTKQFDWRATFDDYEPGKPMGYGETPDEALADLLEQVDDDGLTDADIDDIFKSMPGGPEGFCKEWGYLQFARAVLSARIGLLP
jgi:hypothetical protein